jgi:hypothetical protein
MDKTIHIGLSFVLLLVYYFGIYLNELNIDEKCKYQHTGILIRRVFVTVRSYINTLQSCDVCFDE